MQVSGQTNSLFQALPMPFLVFIQLKNSSYNLVTHLKYASFMLGEVIRWVKKMLRIEAGYCYHMFTPPDWREKNVTKLWKIVYSSEKASFFKLSNGGDGEGQVDDIE